jgi:hypothetical protein
MVHVIVIAPLCVFSPHSFVPKPPPPDLFPFSSSCLFFLPMLNLANIFLFFLLPFHIIHVWVIEKIWLPLNSGVYGVTTKKMIVIKHTPTVAWQPKNFDCHSTPTPLDSDRNFLVTQEGKWGMI